MTSSARGAFCELVVAADLMRQGFEVFRALSPGSPCDLAVLWGARLLRVEVRTAYRTPAGTLYCSRRSRTQPDIWAMVIRHDQEIVYDPPLEQMKAPFNGLT